MSRKKVTVVGSGFVGSTTAQRIVDLELADVVLTDVLDGPPAGKALDMVESGPVTRTNAKATGVCTSGGDYSCNGKQRRGGHHRRIPAQTRHEPRTTPEDELRCGERCGRTDCQALSGLHPHRRDQPARRDGTGRTTR